ncbi:type II toxin-antitoxin system RelE/ParE family toxin [candidate division WOR-3 bacterium]|nr:type II toxin-antitoxin system RelE/ParE family toxin [candidate division WOR-3 bacterium]
MMLSREALRSGRRCTVFALVVDRGCEVTDYLMGLPEDVRSKMETVIRVLADEGFVPNQQTFRRLDAGVYELKLRNPPVRLFCFKDGRNWVCTHGHTKPGPHELRTHVAKVKSLRKRWLEEYL